MLPGVLMSGHSVVVHPYMHMQLKQQPTKHNKHMCHRPLHYIFWLPTAHTLSEREDSLHIVRAITVVAATIAARHLLYESLSFCPHQPHLQT